MGSPIEWEYAWDVFAHLFLLVMSVVMMAGRLPKNPLFGIRNRATLRDERVWATVNAVAGYWLFGGEVTALVLWLFIRDSGAAGLRIRVAVMLVAIMLGAWHGMAIARRRGHIT